MTTPTKFTAIALVLAGLVTLALQGFGRDAGPAQTVERLVAATARGDGARMLEILLIEPHRMPQSAFPQRPVPTLASKMRLHGVRALPSSNASTARVEVDASHVPLGEVIGIALIGGLARGLGGGDAAWEQALTEVEALPASARSTFTVTLTRDGDVWRIPTDDENGEFLMVLGMGPM